MASFQKNSSANFNFSKTINYEKSTIISKDTQGKIHQEKKEELPKSQVFSYFLENGSRITARPSGTEPKIKFYLNLTGTNKKSLNELETTILQKIRVGTRQPSPMMLKCFRSASAKYKLR